jgi:hypothetical protein
MTNKPVAPPSMNMKPGSTLPGRKPSAPQARTFVESEKIDPSAFGIPRRKSPEQEILENAEPITPPPEPRPEPVIPDSPPLAEPKQPKTSVFDELVPESILDRIVREYGIVPTETFESSLVADGMAKPLVVCHRALNWDDYNWGIGVLSDMLSSPEEKSFLASEGQRTQMYQAIVACRCVLKIDNDWVWDVFKARDAIANVNPSWTGDTQVGIPPTMIGLLAKQVLSLFRTKLHFDFLVALDEAVRSFTKEASSDDSDGDHPTQAT